MSVKKVLGEPESEFSFEEVFGKLGEMVQTLEAGDLSLEQATHLYEAGMQMAQKCNELLNSAELRVNKIQESFGEQMRLLKSDQSAEITASTPDQDHSDQ